MDEIPKKPTRPTLDEIMCRIKWPFNRFYLFLLIAVIFALVMGAASYGIYRMSDAASLDLSLPSHQDRLREEREKRELPSKEIVVDPAGVVDGVFANQVADYLRYYQDSVGEAQPFAPDVLLDENLINLSTIKVE